MKRDNYIKSLDLEPHQEGGWFRQVYTSDQQFYDEDSDGNRFYYTSIYFLLDYHDFEMLKKADLLKQYPEYKEVIERLALD